MLQGRYRDRRSSIECLCIYFIGKGNKDQFGSDPVTKLFGTSAESNFREIYCNAVEYGLSLSGENVGYLIQRDISRQRRMALENMNSKSLRDSLEGELGSWAFVVERRIVMSIFSQLGFEQVPSNFIVGPGYDNDFDRVMDDLTTSYNLSAGMPLGDLHQEKTGSNLGTSDTFAVKVHLDDPHPSE
jgi:hypothetical protein